MAHDDDLAVAAFFDLDKTVIAKASMVAFSRPLFRAGMLTRRMLLKAARILPARVTLQNLCLTCQGFAC